MSLEHHLTRRALLAGATGAAAGALWSQAVAAEPPVVPASIPLPRPGASIPAQRIWDCHAHFSGYTGSVPRRVDQMLAAADRVGIERITLFMGLSFSDDPSPDEMRRENDDVLRALAYRPDRLFGFVYLNPNHVEASLAELDRCVRDGPMVGIKLWIAAHCNRPELDPIVRRAVELKIPVLQHTFFRLGGNLPGESSPADLAELAARHPDARFIAAHSGADWEQGVRAIRASANVWAETCGFDPTCGQVELSVRELGASRVLFGSDAGGRSFASQLAKAASAGLCAADLRKIYYENYRGLLEPVFQAKGIKL